MFRDNFSALMRVDSYCGAYCQNYDTDSDTSISWKERICRNRWQGIFLPSFQCTCTL